MKGILEFKLYEEEEEFLIAQRGSKYLGVLQDFDNFLRGELKYRSEDISEETYAKIEEIRNKLHEECDSMGVSLWN